MSMTELPAPGMRWETVSEHMARDMDEGRFPEKSERKQVPDIMPASEALGLKPCPFCQSDDVMVLDVEPTGQMSEYSHVICCDCNATGPMKRSDNAAEEAWNRRAPTGGRVDE